MKILLCGYMGAGKSYWLKNLPGNYAQRVDLDLMIEKQWGPIAQIFAQKGEAFFRQCESEILDRLLMATGNQLIALGGGALNTALIERLPKLDHGLLWLDTEIDICLDRIAQSDRPKAVLSRAEHLALYELRKPLFSMANWRVGEDSMGKIVDDEQLFNKMLLIMKGRIDEAHRHSS